MELFGLDPGSIWPFIAVGFLAQAVDGAMGMAFGAISNTLLVGMLGIPPAQASHRIHVVKIFTTAASGASHLFTGNVDPALFFRLVTTGVMGGIAGIFLITAVNPDIIGPIVLTYLGVIGVMLILRGIKGAPKRKQAQYVGLIGLVGGFFDAVGGGWGPVVTPNLMIQGTEPRMVIGSVNAAEFFLTIVISAAFIMHIGVADLLGPSVGLLIGGMAAAPFGALVAKRAPARLMMVLVGAVLSATGAYGAISALSSG